MEKAKPHHSISEIKTAFSNPGDLGPLTGSARDGIRALRFSYGDGVAVIQNLSIRDFQKSMTSLRDHTIWQDDYAPTFQGIRLYVKFTRDEEGRKFVLLSFKANDAQ